MINNISLALRNVFPLESHPAILREWKLVFQGAGGMANVHSCPGSYFHGVLHLLTSEQMKTLDKIEASYKHVDVQVELYDGRCVEAAVYKMDEAKIDPTIPNRPPSERYIDIIVRGCVHYGVAQSHIDWLKEQHFVPRKSPKDYNKIPTPPSIFFTQQELSTMDGLEGRDMGYSMNGKVLKFVGTPQQKLRFAFVTNNYAGTDATLRVARMLYEPLYPVAESLDKMPLEHRSYCEDATASMMLSLNPPAWQPIGWLKGHPTTLQLQQQFDSHI